MVHEFGVCGVQHKNVDGVSRQAYLQRLAPGDPLKLIHDRHNHYSRWAIRVCDSEGNQVGYVPESISQRVFELGQAGQVRCTRVKQLSLVPCRDVKLLTLVAEIEYSTDSLSILAWTDHVAELQKERTDNRLADEYQDLLEEILLDGVITEDENQHARIFASGMPVPALRAVHGRVYRKALGKAVLGGNVSDEEVQQLQELRGLLDQLGFAP
jgi:HIRAN domain